MATLTLSFDEVLAGACGSVEAEAAQRWLDAGAPLYERPPGLLTIDEGSQGLDMRIQHNAPPDERKRRTSGHGLLPSPVKHPPRQPAASNRATPASSTQQPRQPTGTAVYVAAAVQENIYSRAAFLQHGDAIGLASRRKGRGLVAPEAFQLPAGWQVKAVAGRAATLQQPQAQQKQQQQQQQQQAQGRQQKLKQQQQSAAAAPASQQQQQQQQQQYISPEGLVLPSLQAVQDVLQGPVIVPRKIVRYVRSAAADPQAALAAADTTRGRGHMLGLRRARVALVKEEELQMRRRIAAALGLPLGGSPAMPPSDRQLRRRS